MTRSDVSLHIEEIVLHGFESADRHVIMDAIQQELSRVLGNQFGGPGYTPLLSSERVHADAGTFQVEAPIKANAVGTQIAQTVHGVLLQ